MLWKKGMPSFNGELRWWCHRQCSRVADIGPWATWATWWKIDKWDTWGHWDIWDRLSWFWPFMSTYHFVLLLEDSPYLEPHGHLVLHPGSLSVGVSPSSADFKGPLYCPPSQQSFLWACFEFLAVVVLVPHTLSAHPAPSIVYAPNVSLDSSLVSRAECASRPACSCTWWICWASEVVSLYYVLSIVF